MQIGAMNHPGKDPIAEITWFGEHGFDFVDFTLEPPCAGPDDIDPAAIKDALARHGLGVVAHCAWYIPLSSPLSGLRRAALNEFRRSLKAAHAIGAAVMNTHYMSAPPLFRPEKTVEWTVETLAPLCREAAELGITIVLENTPAQGGNQLENLVAIMERVPLLRFHLDSGHTKLERSYDRFDEYLKKLGHKLRHVHLSENDGTFDQHLPLGAAPRSRTDWPSHIKKLKATGYDGTISLEIFAEHRQYLLLSQDLLKQWWAEA
ncbi:MAG: sugar phosphate isomerase/epimerase family protein [Anaerolineae bacterium]